MENEAKFRLTGLITRTVALVLAVVSLALGAAAIGVIQSNDPLVEEVINADDDEELQLRLVVTGTQNAGSWLIFLAICVFIGETVAVVLLLLKVVTGRLVLDILEIVFSFVLTFLYFSSGIASAFYAVVWSAPPEECTSNEDIDCMEDALTAINALQALTCFAQMVTFGFIGSFVIFTIVKRSSS